MLYNALIEVSQTATRTFRFMRGFAAEQRVQKIEILRTACRLIRTEEPLEIGQSFDGPDGERYRILNLQEITDVPQKT